MQSYLYLGCLDIGLLINSLNFLSFIRYGASTFGFSIGIVL